MSTLVRMSTVEQLRELVCSPDEFGGTRKANQLGIHRWLLLFLFNIVRKRGVPAEGGISYCRSGIRLFLEPLSESPFRLTITPADSSCLPCYLGFKTNGGAVIVWNEYLSANAVADWVEETG